MIRRETLVGVLSITVGLLTAAVAALLIMTEVRGGRAERAVDAALARADRAIEQGNLPAAEEALLAGAAAARTAPQWLSLTKRAYRIAESTGDMSPAADLAGRGTRAAPNDLDLLAVAVHTHIRAGRPADALLLLEDVPSTTRLDALQAEARLAARSLTGDATDPVATSAGADARLPDGQFSVLVGLGRESPAADYAAAFDLTRARSFAVNEALRLAESGETGAALGALEERNLVSSVPVLAAFLAYDLEDYERYERLLQAMSPRAAVTPEQLMLQADIAMLRGNYAAAGAVYEDLRATAPAFSPEQYLNAAWLQRGNRQAARDILSSRGNRFSSFTDIARAEILLAYQEDPAAARRLLDSYRGEVADPVVLDTLAMHLFERRRGSVAGVVSRLWTLLNRHPESELPVRYLGWYLVSTGDWPELSVLLDRKIDTTEEIGALYGGILAVRDRNWSRALELFSAEENRSWQAAHNAGLAAIGAGAPASSHEHFEEALLRLSDAASALEVGEEARMRHRSRILAADGLAHGLRGNYAAAYRRAAEAVELDSDNVRARYLMTTFADRL
jgi:tetratricopeptide (TPR) repeat protein